MSQMLQVGKEAMTDNGAHGDVDILDIVLEMHQRRSAAYVDVLAGLYGPAGQPEFRRRRWLTADMIIRWGFRLGLLLAAVGVSLILGSVFALSGTTLFLISVCLGYVAEVVGR